MARLTTEAVSDDDEPVAVSDRSIYVFPIDEEDKGYSEEDKKFRREARSRMRDREIIHEKKFEELTKDGKYMNQHWHLKEWRVTNQSRNRTIPDEEFLLLCHNPEFWNIYLYGDCSNRLTNVLQIYSIKLEANDDDYPLRVYGNLRLATTDFSRQFIFRRPRKRSQTLTKEDPYLVLTGPLCHPSAPPSVSLCLVSDLKLKGTTLSEDKHLTQSARCEHKNLPAHCDVYYSDVDTDPEDPYLAHLSNCCNERQLCKCEVHGKVKGTHKQYLLKMTRSIVTCSVVATIGMELVGSNSPTGFLDGRSLFTAYMESLRDNIDTKIVLLDSRDGKVPIKFCDYKFDLLRSTICVEHFGILIVYIEHGEIKKELRFKPQESGQKVRSVDIGPCKIQVKVEWSLYWKHFNRLVKDKVI